MNVKEKEKNVESEEWSGNERRSDAEKGRRKVKKLLIPAIIS